MGAIELKSIADMGTNAGPKYMRLRDQLHEEIHSGRIAPGHSLPAEAKLMEQLGISRSTVRQALSELENEGMIERIQGRGTFVAPQGSHRLNQQLQQLDMFALIGPRLREGGYASLIHGFEEACADCSHQTLIGNSGNDVGRQADLIIQLVCQSVGGVALVPTTTVPPTPPHQIRLLQQNKIPVVYCNRTVEGVSAPSVVFSGHEIGMKAGQILSRLGHRRIAFLFSQRYSMVDERERGLHEAFAVAGFDPNGIVAVAYGTSDPPPSPHCEKAIQRAMAAHFSGSDRPTAVFCNNVLDAEVVFLQAQAAGIQIPRDLSLIYFGGKLREHGLAGRLSAVAVDEHNIGATAARLLHEIRSGKRAIDNDEQVVLPISELLGETLGPAPKA